MIMPIAEFVTYMKSFFTVESTAQTACDWYELGSIVIPSYFLYVQLL